MKKFLISIVLVLSITQLVAQQNRFILCKMSITKYSGKQKIKIDYGDKDMFSLLNDTSFLSKTDSVVNYKNETDAIRYFKNLGWEMLGITSTPYANRTSFRDYIFWRKKIDK
jgi:hypothetical protein